MRDVTKEERAQIIGHMECAKEALAARRGDTLLEIYRTLRSVDEYLVLARAECIVVCREAEGGQDEAKAA